MRLCCAISGMPILVLLASMTLQAQPGPKPSPGVPAARNPYAPPKAVAPARPAQMPPSPPRIGFTGGELVVMAENCTLADVLAAIQKATGASVEGMIDDNRDRVFGQFGPDSPRNVVGALLAGSQYNYVMAGDASDPGSFRRVILLPRPPAPPRDEPLPREPEPVAEGFQPAEPPSVDVAGDPAPQNPAPQNPIPQNPAPQNPTSQNPYPPYQAGQQYPGAAIPAAPSPQSPQDQQNQPPQPPQPPRLPQHWGANSPAPNNGPGPNPNQ